MRIRNLYGVLVLICVSVMLAASPAIAEMLVSADWLKAHANDPNVVIVDVQSKGDLYEKGHIPGAVKVDRHKDLEDYTQYPPNKYPQKKQFLDLASRLGIGNDSIIVAYDDKYGLFASRMLVVMELYGHDTSRLKLLDGGTTAWNAAGNKLTPEASGTAAKVAYKTAGPNKDMLLTWQEVYKNTVLDKNPKFALHDARPADEYSGRNIRAVRGGHIPGSKNLTGVAAANNKEEHTFKSAADIRKTFESAGITQDKTVYTYCHSADRAAHAYVVLKHLLGYKDVKIYDGSWTEWSMLTALPAEGEIWAASSQVANK